MDNQENRDNPLQRIRNIGVIAHIDAGKTTTTERILFYTGRTYRLGNVDDGTTVTDWMDQERERGITIVSAAVTCEWRGHRINIIDTPGHIDFTAEVQRSLRVLDGGVVVFDAVQGVEPQSETVWRQADRFRVPRICFINKMDRTGADFWRSIAMIRDRLKAVPVAIQVPIGAEASFRGYINLIDMRAMNYQDDDLGVELHEVPIPPELAEQAAEHRAQLLEAIAETDDVLLAKYLEGEEPSSEELRAALRRATLANQLVPVLCGSALRNKGVQPVLDAIVDFLPAPTDIPPIEGIRPGSEETIERRPDPSGPFSALVFKIVTDPFVGRLAYLRVYSGTLNANSSTLNATKSRKERIARLLRMYANRREELTEVAAGDIAAVGGLKFSFTGDTLCDADRPILLESIRFPEPVIYQAVEPRTAADESRMLEAMRALADEDPTFCYRTDESTGQTIMSGMGELHLEILSERLVREFHVAVRVGKPQVAYRETVTGTAAVSEEVSLPRAGKPQMARVSLSIQPTERGQGILVSITAPPEQVPSAYVPAMKNAITESLSAGLIAGYPVVDVAVEITGGAFDETSTESAFIRAAAQAAQRAGMAASPVLLEPVMKVETLAPADNVGDVIGDMNARRGSIEGMELLSGDLQAVRAHAPLSEMFGYATVLRSNTQGRGAFTMEFDYYAPVPPDVTRRIMGTE
ncbi:MAG: elongation factor G [Chloroflexi bacterium]|nr:elongation factor G [Chloroflexota bacterium]